MKIRNFAIATCLAVSSLSGIAGELILDNGMRSQQDLERDTTSKPAQIMKFSGLKQNMVVGDILGGGGYYSELISQVIGENGKVYLHNNKAYMPYVGKELNKRLEGKHLTNVIRHDREVDNLDFKANSLDMVYFVMGYHDMYHVADGWEIDPDKFIGQLKTALKPGGLMLIIDHSAPTGTKTELAQTLHRIDENYVKDQMTKQGFSLVKESQLLRNPNDSREISPFKKEIRRKTDRFVLLFKKNPEKQT